MHTYTHKHKLMHAHLEAIFGGRAVGNLASPLVISSSDFETISKIISGVSCNQEEYELEGCGNREEVRSGMYN